MRPWVGPSMRNSSLRPSREKVQKVLDQDLDREGSRRLRAPAADQGPALQRHPAERRAGPEQWGRRRGPGRRQVPRGRIESTRDVSDLSQLTEAANTPTIGRKADCEATELSKKSSEVAGCLENVTVGRRFDEEVFTVKEGVNCLELNAQGTSEYVPGGSSPRQWLPAG